MAQSILQIFEKSGDQSIGETIVRLAGLAAAAHRFEISIRPDQVGAAPALPIEREARTSYLTAEAGQDLPRFSFGKGQGREEGIDPLTVVHGPRRAADPLHTEVIR